MANLAGDSLVNNPPKLDEQQASPSAFPNTRWIKITTDLTRNPGTFDDVFKKIKGTNSMVIDCNCSMDLLQI